MNRTLIIAVTGAGGFIGRQCVAAARERGHIVRALVRSNSSAAPEWRNDQGVTFVPIDLTSDDASAKVEAALDGVDAVIHAAAAMSGDDDHHARNTLKPAETLLAAIAGCGRAGRAPRLVMVSSIAVYDAAALTEGATLDETASLEANPDDRDAYCRSKLALEALTLWAADAHNLEVRIMRPGAVFGPGRLWNGHLGQALGPLVVQLEKRGQVPVSFVNHCAEALVLAAERPLEHDDRTEIATGGRVEIINVLDNDLPDRARYMEALRISGWPRFVLPGSWRSLAGLADMLSYLGRFAPGVKSKLPGLLRSAVIHSRMKPLVYSNSRLHDRLGWQSNLLFEEVMERSAAGQYEDNAHVSST